MNPTTIKTLSGQPLDYLNPQPDNFDIEDIATALAHNCRFAGQLPLGSFFSVAQHSVNVSILLGGTGQELAGLMHDASEAYTGDITTPLKRAVPAFNLVEDMLQIVIAEKFGFEFPHSAEVKRADYVAFIIEKHFIRRDPMPWNPREDDLPSRAVTDNLHLQPLTFEQAYNLFMGRYNELQSTR
jgi:hypothetical protein